MANKLMRYRLLGRSGFRVSELCFGTMTFGEQVDQLDQRRVIYAQ